MGKNRARIAQNGAQAGRHAGGQVQQAVLATEKGSSAFWCKDAWPEILPSGLPTQPACAERCASRPCSPQASCEEDVPCRSLSSATTCASSGPSTPRELPETADDALQTDAEDASEAMNADDGLGAQVHDPEVSNVVFVDNEDESERTILVQQLAQILTTFASARARPQQMTCFHGARVPPLSLHDYLSRIASNFFCSNECFVLSLIYIDRLLRSKPEVVVSPLSVHKVVLTSLLCAVKFYDDHFYSNAYYARVGGVPLQEMNRLEAKFLQLIDWQLFVTPEQHRQYRSMVEQFLDKPCEPDGLQAWEKAEGRTRHSI